MKKLLFPLLLLLALFFSCTKDKDKNLTDTEELSLIGKWNEENSMQKYYNKNGALILTVENPGVGAIWQFQENGSLSIEIPGLSTPPPTPYTIKSTSKVDIDGMVWEIQNLTRSHVTLFRRDDFLQQDGPVEFFINLAR